MPSPPETKAPVMILAGEASADHHAAKIVSALKARGVETFGMGGDTMIASGFDAVAHARDISVMGFWAVLRHLRRILGVEKNLQAAIDVRKPRIALLLDLPDFNLRMARFLKSRGVYVIYYISPQVWAWRQKRVSLIREVVDEMLCVLPFEERFYRERDVAARFIGHPLVEDLTEKPDTARLRAELGPGPLVGLLPGSRRQETVRLLAPMLEAARELKQSVPDVRFILPLAGTSTREVVDAVLAKYPDVRPHVRIIEGRSQEVLALADSAVVASGTATLEAALIGVPFVAVYRISFLTFAILRRVVKVSSIILANLILGEKHVEELLQRDVNGPRIARALLERLKEGRSKEGAQATRQKLLTALGARSPTEEVTNAIMARVERSK
jgi:lipid-A-disaccharide synthase